MKKRNILILLLSWVCLCVSAVPAKQGRWRTVQLQDGKMVRVQLCGDERLHFFADAEGNRYLPVKDAGDNAAMVGSQGYYEFLSGNVAGTDLNAFATMSIEL